MEEKGLQLTAKNELFIRFILAGKRTPEAHKLAGYNGDPHAAYELRSRLNKAISAAARAGGVSEEGVLSDIAALDELPVAAPAAGITVDQKLKVVALKHKVLTDRAEGERELTTFVIGKRPVKVVEAEVVNVAQPEAQSSRGDSGGVGEAGEAMGEPSIPAAGEESPS